MNRAWLLFPLALNWLATPVEADVLSEAGVGTLSSGGSFSPFRPDCRVGGTGTASVDVSCAENGNSGRGQAQAVYGDLKSYAELSATSSIPGNGDYQAFGRARFDDILTLTSPLLEPGIPEFVNVVFDLTGSTVKDGPDFDEPGSLFTFTTLIVKVNGVTIEAGFGGGTEMPFSFQMFPGSPVLFSAELVADVRCFGCDVPYEGIVDVLNTASLTRVEVGILNAEDFTISSGDGESYGNIVPEPDANTAMLVAITALGFVRNVRLRASRA